MNSGKRLAHAGCCNLLGDVPAQEPATRKHERGADSSAPWFLLRPILLLVARASGLRRIDSQLVRRRDAGGIRIQ